MTIADLLPVRLGRFDRPARKPRHRASDEVERLKFLLGGAHALIRGMRVQLDDKDREHAKTIARIDERHGETVRGLEARITELEHRLNVGVLAEHVVARTQELNIDEIRKHCVMPLDQARDAGLLGPVTNPGHVHAKGVV